MIVYNAKISKARAPETQLRVHIIGAQRLINELICYYLAREVNMSCSESAFTDMAKILEAQPEARPQVVLLDYYSPDIQEKLKGDFRDFLVELKTIPAIIFNFRADTRIKKWITFGIRGILYEWDSLQSINRAVNAVAQGHMWFPRQAMSSCLSEMQANRTIPLNQNKILTPREREILSMVAKGNTNAEVAEKLFISPFTVKVHLQRIFKKIKVANRIKAVLWAQRNLEI